jgi:predicted dehydrogenase
MAICLVGTRWGQFLGTQLRQIYSGPLFVCGCDPQRTRRIARSLNAEDALTGWEAAVSHPRVSSLILALPVRRHFEAALGALRAGKNVLVEKPMATCLHECDELIDAASAYGVVFAVAENISFRPDVQAAKRLLPLIGEPRLFFGSALHGASGRNDLSAGILLDFGVHHIRAVRELYGEPDGVYASRARGAMGSDAEDNMTLLLSANSGWQATLVFSWQGSPGRCPEFIATGTHGAIKIWSDSSEVNFYPREPGFWARAVSRVRPYWLRSYFESPEIQRHRFRLTRRDPLGYQAELRCFIDAVQRGNPDTLSAQAARRDIEIAVAAQTSLSNGVRVDCRPRTRLQLA